MASDAGVKNIEQLAQFGKNIKNLGQNMYQTMQAAQQRMNAVSEGWQDKQNDKFREQFDRSVQDIKKMSEMFTEYSNYIAKITSKLMEYQSIRYAHDGKRRCKGKGSTALRVVLHCL